MKRAGAIAAVAFLLGAAFATGLYITRGDRSHDTRLRAAAPRLVDQVRRELATRYYRSVPARALRQATVDDILVALDDPYTEYLNAAEYEQLKSRTAKSYSGVGLTVERSRRGLVVRSAYPGPAREAGIARGDVIVAIDGHPVNELSFERSLTLITGRPGTKVRLTVRRTGGHAGQVTVVREEISLPTIRTRILATRGAKIGYLRLVSFPANASESLARETDRLRDRGARALVLDLRDNPGGLLAEAIEVVSLFQERGIVCTTDGLHQPRRVFDVSGEAPYAGLPLVVLVNRGSASAAEIVAGALRDNARAIVVGERTYGKALIQTVRELSNGEAIKLTTAVFVTPAGSRLEDGLRPGMHAVDHPATPADEALLAAKRVLLEQLAA